MYINTVFSLFLSILRQDKKLVIRTFASLFLTIVVCLLTMSLPVIFSLVIKNLSHIDKSAASITLILLAGYGLLWITTQALGQIRSLVIVHVIENVIARLSLLLFKHLHSLSLRFHLDRKTGAVLNSLDRAQMGCESVVWGILLFLFPVSLELLFTLLVLLYYYGLWHCIGLVTLLTLFIVANLAIIGKLNQAQAIYNEKRAQASSALLDSLINVETSKYFANQKSDYQNCQSLLHEQTQAGVHRQIIETLLGLVQMFVMGLGFALVTFITGKRVVDGQSSLAEFVLINGYFLQFIMPLQHIVFAFGQVRKGMQDIAQVQEILCEEPEIKDALGALTLAPETVEIVFDNVSFGYTPEQPILKNISFKIAHGKTIALVGPSGSGKSTLIKLLFRLFDVTQGAIYVNGHDIRSISQESLRKMLAIVPQDVVLFNNTLKFNIAYGNLAATQQEIENAACQAQLDTFIKGLPDGYETQVGERGLKLSGGEKQRVGIARALLKEPCTYVFDEATSALDSYTEHEIQNQIRDIAFGATTLIVAHRLSTVRHADEIVVLEAGCIVEQGSHQELVLNNGLYQKLWQNQTSCGAIK